MKHSITTILIAVLMSMIGVNVFAHDIAVANSNCVTIYYNWINNNTELSVSYRGSSSSDYSNEYTGSIVIPSSVVYQGNTYSVTSIGSSAFVGCSGLTSVTISNSVTSLGNYAFSGCSGLTKIISEIENPFAIDNSVFDGIPSNATLIVPPSTKSAYQSKAGWNKFANIVEIEKKQTIHVATAGTLPDLIPDYEKYYIEELTLTGELNGTDLAFLREMAGQDRIINFFDDDSDLFDLKYGEYLPQETQGKLIDLDISNVNIVSGGSPSLYLLGDADEIYSSDNTIPAGLFFDCKLSSIKLPRSISNIESLALGHCPLTYITIPNSVTSISDDVFYGCSSLESMVVENSNTKYDSRNNCKAIIETESNTLIAGCKNTIIPNSVTTIGSDAFYKCGGLTSVTIPNSVTSLGNYAFSGCSGLTSVTIPNSVTSIGSYAFYGCSGLTSVSIPNSVTSIGSDAFAYCSGLTSVTIPNSVTSIGSGAFHGTAWYNNQPDGLVYAGKVAYKYKGDMPENISVTIKDGTLGIAGYAFYYCSGLTSVTIPNSVTSIRGSAFYGCSGLTSVTIPNSVTSIGNYAFSGCSGLTSVIVGNGMTNIGSNSYGWSSTNLKEMILSQTAYENGIPASVTKFTTYSKNPMRVVVTSKGATSATMKIYPIDESGNTNEDNSYTVTMLGLTPGQYITWKLDDENYGIISEKTNALALEVQPAKPTSKIKARLLATVNELDDDLHFGFEWLRYDAPSNMTPNKVSAPLYEGQIVGSLNNLNPDVYYKYRPYYKSEDGSMFYGEWESFITGDADVFFEPETHTKDVVEVTSASAQLVGVWIEGTEDIEEKGFEYWTVSGGNTRAVGKDVKTVVVSGNKMSVTIEGLIPGKNYGYRSYIKTVSGKTYGEEKTFKTVLAGDVNGDGSVNEADVEAVADYIMGNAPTGFNKDTADVNNDNKVNAADIVLINKLVKK